MSIILTQKINHDIFTEYVGKMYDVPLQKESISIINNNINFPEKWNIGLIYGESGRHRRHIFFL